MSVRVNVMYLQDWKGWWRVRQSVPKPVKDALRKEAPTGYFIKALGLKIIYGPDGKPTEANKREAERLSRPIREDNDCLIKRAQRGDWPQFDAEAIAVLGHAFWGWATEGYAVEIGQRFDTIEGWFLEDRLRIREALVKFLRSSGQHIAEDAVNFARLLADIESHLPAAVIRHSPCVAQPIASTQVAAMVPSEIITSDEVPYTFNTLVAEFAKEREVVPTTESGWRGFLMEVKKIVGHDNARRLSERECVRYKDSLVERGLHPTTIANRIICLSTMWNVAVANSVRTGVAVNPWKAVKYRQPKVVMPTRNKAGFSDTQARAILEAARKETKAHLRWVPWLEACLGGPRAEEVLSAQVADFEQIDGIWVFHVRLDHREPTATVKTVTSVRMIPLPDELIEEGFLDYFRSLPPRPLFPEVKLSKRTGKRGETAGKAIQRWVRKIVTDKRLAQQHAWRDRFRTLARRYGVHKEYVDAIQGHGDIPVGQTYGENPLLALKRELDKVKQLVEPVHLTGVDGGKR